MVELSYYIFDTLAQDINFDCVYECVKKYYTNILLGDLDHGKKC